MSTNTFSYILSALSLLSLWLMGNKNKLGIVVGLANQLLWVVYALMLNSPEPEVNAVEVIRKALEAE